MDSAPTSSFNSTTSTGGLPLDTLSGQPAALSSQAATDCGAWRERLVDGPRWMLLAALVLAPWAYGCTRPWAATALHQWLALTLTCWAVALLVRGRLPSVHPFLLGAGSVLVLLGGWMAANAKFNFDARWNPLPLEPLLDWAPGSVNRALSVEAAFGAAVMLGAACLACDLARPRAWRRRLFFTLAVAGVSIALFGLVQKAAHAPGIFWRQEKFAETFFATYRYHANAGSFLNVIWPIVAAFAVLSYRQERSLAERCAWSAALAIGLAAAFANTSRATSLIALMLLFLWGAVALVKAVRGRWRETNPTAVAGVAFGFLALIVLIISFGGLDAAWHRWSVVGEQFTARNPRLLVVQICLEMLPHSGWFGFGPGTFQSAFPFFNRDTGVETRGIWIHAHQDYLQTLIEWGRLGTALWSVVMGGALVLGARLMLGHRHQLGRTDRLFLVAALAAVAAVLVHACADFPLQVASIQLYVAVLIGALWSGRHWLNREAGRRTLSQDR